MTTSTISVAGKPVRVTLTPAAREALWRRDTRLLAEMELYFSCLIRKQVRFREAGTNEDSIAVNERLHVRFHPVMTARCGVDYDGDEPPVTDFPITRPEAFTPAWLRIDFRNHQWLGEFGFAR